MASPYFSCYNLYSVTGRQAVAYESDLAWKISEFF